MTRQPAHGSPARPGAGSAPALVTALALSALSFAVMQSLVVPALPAIRSEFGLTGTQAAWVLTATLLASAVSTPLLGRLGDLYGRKTILLAILVALAFGILAVATAQSFAWLLIGRALQGCAGAVFPLAFGLIGEQLPSRHATNGIGFVSSMSAAGIAIGVVTAAALVGQIGFRATFWLFLIPVLAAIGMVIWTVPRRRGSGRTGVNWSSALLMCGWLSALLIAVTAVAAQGWLSPIVLTWLAVSAVLVLWWAVVERSSIAPLVDLRMLASPVNACSNTVSLLLGFVMYAAFAFLPDFSVAVVGSEDSLSPAAYLLPWAAFSFAAGLASGPVTVRFGARSTVVAGMAATAGSLALLAASEVAWQVLCGSAVLGLGSGLATGAVASLVVSAAPPDRRGVATSVTTNARLIGGTLGTQIFASVVAMGAPADVPSPASSYHSGFIMLTAAGGLALLAALAIPRSGGSPQGRCR